MRSKKKRAQLIDHGLGVHPHLLSLKKLFCYFRILCEILVKLELNIFIFFRNILNKNGKMTPICGFYGYQMTHFLSMMRLWKSFILGF